MALCINQHLEYLQQDYSSSLFSAAVNAGTSDLIFSDYDTRRQAAAFLSQLSEEPAQPLTAAFVRNPDATLSLSDDSLQAVLAAFARRPPRHKALDKRRKLGMMNSGRFLQRRIFP